MNDIIFDESDNEMSLSVESMHITASDELQRQIEEALKDNRRQYTFLRISIDNIFPTRTAYGSDGDYFSKPNHDDIFEAIYAVMSESNPELYKKLY